MVTKKKPWTPTEWISWKEGLDAERSEEKDRQTKNSLVMKTRDAKRKANRPKRPPREKRKQEAPILPWEK